MPASGRAVTAPSAAPAPAQQAGASAKCFGNLSKSKAGVARPLYRTSDSLAFETAWKRTSTVDMHLYKC
ncbi:hypothetical protein [Streptomyces sp. NPDC055189]